MRRLGSGSRSEVFLGHSEAVLPGDSRLAAIKVFRPGTDEASVAAEIEALTRLSHPHSVRLLDLAAVDGPTPCLIMQRLVPGGLARLLADRSTMTAGEAVTILAPIASAVSSLHRVGVSHRGVKVCTVLFDDRGAPVLIGFGGAGFIGGSDDPDRRTVTEAMIEADAGAQRDYRALDALTRTVLDRVTGAQEIERVDELVHWLDSESDTSRSSSFASELGERMFGIAEATPVRVGQVGSLADGIPHRLGGKDTAVSNRVAASSDESVIPSDDSARWLDALPLPTALAELLSGLVESTSPALRAGIGAIRRVRKPVWVAAAAGFAAILIAVLLSHAPSGVDSESPAGVVQPATTDEQIASDVVAEDDPVTAASELLARRTACFDDRSILCLDGVDQAGSAAWDADASHIRALQAGAEIEAVIGEGELTPTLIDRMGDSALVALTTSDEVPSTHPASVLMIKTEAGWRIRNLMSGSVG